MIRNRLCLLKISLCDFVYSISVFTHLPEDMQLRWLEELSRVTKPDGVLALSVHGAGLFNGNPQQKKDFNKAGFYYLKGSGTTGLPEFYQTAYHAEEYIYSRWSKFFTIVKIRPRGIANRQDLVLCQPRFNGRSRPK
ncbi:class I SAM-dependent methyltransferase [Acidisoma sp. L85]|uniref:class I SAM-dependent methyltransferase n=1 Tax=Acidisoma sp. L85 TaxID=1641850 RepID=UPI00352BC640